MAFNPSNAFCPVSPKSIDERIARINAGITAGLVGVFITGNFAYTLIFLAIDFLLRTSGKEKLSLVAIASSNIARYLKVRKNIINAGPKLFAARIGFFLSVLAFVAWQFEWKTFSIVVAAILGLFSFLEAVAGICVACMIYPFVFRVMYR